MNIGFCVVHIDLPNYNGRPHAYTDEYVVQLNDTDQTMGNQMLFFSC